MSAAMSILAKGPASLFFHRLTAEASLALAHVANWQFSMMVNETPGQHEVILCGKSTHSFVAVRFASDEERDMFLHVFPQNQIKRQQPKTDPGQNALVSVI
ncbi:hypothetical protein BCR44DRAFT_1143066 [Catenaria anguillulae PL171]|uniref:Uncharacterized protein n=1 Tax=Catenaria anguillulae PL171 TaxID=765915 RepID=A0A1Y2HJI6_9FUNG|nr:hypothetical protein BCR44DRAFT_1143066 [Catenaria anguillulae PL171]